MLKSNVGYSVDKNAFESGKQTVQKALTGLTSPKICFLFGSSNYSSKELLKGANSVLNNVPIFGCTSGSGIIVPDGVIESKDGFSGALIFDDPNMVVGVAMLPKGSNDRMTGRQLAIEALNDAKMKTRPTYICVIASPGGEEEYLKGIQDIVGRVPCFGGTASDEENACKYQLYCKNESTEIGCAVAFLYTNKKMNLEFTGAYSQTGQLGLLQQMDGNRIVTTINNKKALDLYQEWTKFSKETVEGSNIFQTSALRPIGIRDLSGDLILVKHPIYASGDGAIEFSNNLVTNTALIGLMAGPADLLIGSKVALNTSRMKLKRKAGAYLLFYSLARYRSLKDRKQELHRYIKSETGNTPFIMPFTLSEFGYGDATANLCGSLMMSFASFSEE